MRISPLFICFFVGVFLFSHKLEAASLSKALKSLKFEKTTRRHMDYFNPNLHIGVQLERHYTFPGAVDLDRLPRPWSTYNQTKDGSIFLHMVVPQLDRKGLQQYKSVFPLIDIQDMDSEFFAVQSLLNQMAGFRQRRTPWGKTLFGSSMDDLAIDMAIKDQSFAGIRQWMDSGPPLLGAYLLHDIAAGSRFYPHVTRSLSQFGRSMMRSTYQRTIGPALSGGRADPRALLSAAHFLQKSPGSMFSGKDSPELGVNAAMSILHP